MKIGFVLDDTLDRPDGVQQYVLSIGAWFSTQGHEVHYLVGQTVRTDITNVHSLARTMAVRFNKNRMSMPLPTGARRIRRLLDTELFDVLHVQMPYSPLMAARVVANAPRRTAVIGTFHILPYQRVHRAAARALGLALKRNVRRFDAVIGVSPPAARFAKEVFGAEAAVVPNAVDLKRFYSGKRMRRYDDGRFNVVFLGRLVERKGCAQLLAAAAQLDLELRAKLRIIICGGGPLESKLKAFVSVNGLEGCTEFAGFIDEADKPDYLASADIAVFPSLGGESFGIVLVEAMAAGAGVVLGGNNPGYASVLAEVPEQLFDPRDAGVLACLLTKYARDPAARIAARAWQQSAAHQYDVAVVGTSLTAIYRQALHRRQNLQ